MENRKITIVQTKNQKKSVIMSSATTLSELKEDLIANNIDYEGMTFYEGLSKTELKSDSSVLPHDIERNGVTTNELVFMLTNADKKIKSGVMSRAEVYDTIKRNNLQEVCKKKLGRNYTQCSTIDLILLIEQNKHDEAHADTCNHKCNCRCECVDAEARMAIGRIARGLYDNGCISEKAFNETMKFIKNENSDDLEAPYSDEEIDEMFEDM